MSHTRSSCDDARATQASHFKARATTPELYRARLLLGGVAAALALLVSLILTSMAYATTFETRQAESLGDPDGAGKALNLVMDTNGTPSGTTDNALQYENPATVTYSFGVKAPTGYTRTVKQVDVRARNSSRSRGPVTLTLVVDGVTQDTKTMSRSETSYKMLSWAVSLPDGNHQIGVRGGDLNGRDQLYTDYMVLSGTDTPVTLPADTDGDGVPDSDDGCRDEAGPASNKGCPVSSPPPGATCTSSLQGQIDATPSGGTLVLDPCIYRQRATISKPIILKGQSTTGIRGSDVVSSWSASGDNFVSAVAVSTFRAQPSGYSCQSGTSDCTHQEQVFVDGSQLQQVASGADPRPGQFALDSGRHVVLGDDPRGHTVEVTMRDQWLRVASSASGTIVQDITFRHAASPAGYQGALLSDGASNVSVVGNSLYDAHGSALSMNGGNPMLAESNRIHNAGQLAIHSHQGALTLTGNYIEHSNVSLYNSSWEAGAVKATKQTGGRWSKNVVRDSVQSPGLWCDLSCQGVEIDHNRVDHSGKAGIFYEVSSDGLIHDNVLYENGWSERRADLRIGNSSGVEAYGNVIAWSYMPMSVEMSNRSDVAGANDVRNIAVHDNLVLSRDFPSTASANACDRPLAARVCDFYDGRLYDNTRNITYRNNAYYYSTNEGVQSRWNTNGVGYSTLADWNATPWAEGENYMPVETKNAHIDEHDLPALPEH